MPDQNDLKSNIQAEMSVRTQQLKLLINRYASNRKTTEILADELHRNETAYRILFPPTEEGSVCAAESEGALFSAD